MCRFTSPWKSFKHVVWRNYKWHIITAVVLFFLFLFAFLVLYSLPVSNYKWHIITAVVLFFLFLFAFLVLYSLPVSPSYSSSYSCFKLLI